MERPTLWSSQHGDAPVKLGSEVQRHTQCRSGDKTHRQWRIIFLRIQHNF